jgi:hypothetical protein
MSPKTLTFRLVPRIAQSRGRGIGFLEGDAQLNAGTVFNGLTEKMLRLVRVRMDHWIIGNNQPAAWFHGFPNDADHKHCFVFKWKEKRQGHRLYGFLCNPRPKSDLGFRLCVLCIHATKNEYETDQSELDRVNQWRMSFGTREAIGNVYPEHRSGGSKWTN